MGLLDKIGEGIIVCSTMHYFSFLSGYAPAEYRQRCSVDLCADLVVVQQLAVNIPGALRTHRRQHDGRHVTHVHKGKDTADHTCGALA